MAPARGRPKMLCFLKPFQRVNLKIVAELVPRFVDILRPCAKKQQRRWPLAAYFVCPHLAGGEVTVAATSKNVKSMLKSRKLQSRKTRAFMVHVAAFDGGHVASDKKRGQKKKNFKLARKLMDHYSLSE